MHSSKSSRLEAFSLCGVAVHRMAGGAQIKPKRHTTQRPKNSPKKCVKEGQRHPIVFVSVAVQAHAHCALCIVRSSAHGRSQSCIFEMPSGQVVIGSVRDGGGGPALTRGSGLLIE